MQSYHDLLHARHCLPTALSPSFRSSDTSLWIASKMSRLAIYWEGNKREGGRENRGRRRWRGSRRERRGWGWCTGSNYQFLSINVLMTFDVTFALPWHTHQRWPSAVGSSSEQRPGGTWSHQYPTGLHQHHAAPGPPGEPCLCLLESPHDYPATWHTNFSNMRCSHSIWSICMLKIKFRVKNFCGVKFEISMDWKL